jgi:serine/threonine protein kinase
MNLPPPRFEHLGMLINNRYHIQKLLGRGGFGQTYLAYDTQCFNHPCVLKEFAPASRAEYAMQKARELFEREARVLYEINHPQIPKFLAWFVAQERLFLVQEYIAGKTYAQLLRQRQQQGRTYSEAEVIQWLRNLLPVLDYLHQRQIVHRDISPDNVMLPDRPNAEPVLIDFGLVKQSISQIYSESSRATASFVGKFGYAPPEQIRMGQCFPSSDLYALGVTALVLLTGQEPQLLMDQETLEWHWRNYTNISITLAEILERMVYDKPKARYQSAQEILADLGSAVLPSSPFPRSSPPLLSFPSELSPELLQHCQQEMTRRIGPIASFVLENVLVQNPHATPTQLIEALALEIPDLVQAEEFKACLAARASILDKTISSFSPHSPSYPFNNIQNVSLRQTSASSILSPDFLERCQQALVRCIGPMATLILDDLLQEAQFTPEALVEAIVNEISDPQRAAMFRELMSS